MGNKLWHQYQHIYSGRVREGTRQFAEKVKVALQAGVSGKAPSSGSHVTCLELYVAAPVGAGPYVQYWEIKYREGADYNSATCKNCPNVKRLKDLLDSQNSAFIYDTDFKGENSYHHPIPLPDGDTNVHVDPNANIPLPTQGPNGTPGPYELTDFDTVLWHELLGHAALFIQGQPSSHPNEPWNQYGSTDPRTDSVIDIENQYRDWIGKSLRYGKYYSQSSGQGSCCPE